MKFISPFFLLKHFIATFILLSVINISIAQNDTLIFKNGDVIVGEIKSLDKGVLIIKTGYSKNDFNIEWSGLKEIYSTSNFLITLKNGVRVNGNFRSIDSIQKIYIVAYKGEHQLTTLNDIVYLKGLKTDFWSRVFASIDLGLSVTKANNVRQFSGGSKFGYYADQWQVSIFYNDIRSKQDFVALTKRIESGIGFTYYLPKDWFFNTSLNTLSNTEQALKLRFSGKIGAGKYIIRSNKAYFGAGGGLSIIRETFTNNIPGRSSLEGYLGTEANIYDFGDFSFFSNLYIYPSFTESGRLRSDFKVDTKYKLPHDFYIKLGITFNYDNRPAIEGNKTDYVYTFSVGWKL